MIPEPLNNSLGFGTTSVRVWDWMPESPFYEISKRSKGARMLYLSPGHSAASSKSKTKKWIDSASSHCNKIPTRKSTCHSLGNIKNSSG